MTKREKNRIKAKVYRDYLRDLKAAETHEDLYSAFSRFWYDCKDTIFTLEETFDNMCQGELEEDWQWIFPNVNTEKFYYLKKWEIERIEKRKSRYTR